MVYVVLFILDTYCVPFISSNLFFSASVELSIIL